MANRADRAVFVFPDARSAVAVAGGTMARVVEEGGTSTLITALPLSPGEHDALARLTGGDHVVAAGPGDVVDVAENRAATVLIAPGVASPAAAAVAVAAGEAAHRLGVPLFRVTDGAEPSRRIDIGLQRDAKLDALVVLGGATGATANAAGAATESFQLVDDAADGAAADASTTAATGSRAASVAEPTTIANRIWSVVLAFVIGVVVGAVGTVAHTTTVAIAGVDVPIGLILAVIAVVSLLVGLRLVMHDRLIVGACAAGLVGIVALFTLPSFGGSVLIPEGILSVIWTLTPAFTAALVLAWPSLPPRAQHAHRAAG